MYFVYSFLAYTMLRFLLIVFAVRISLSFFFFFTRGSSVFLVMKNPYDMRSQIRFLILPKKRTLRSNEQKKKQQQLCTRSTLFEYISLPLFCRTTTTRNFQKLPSYTFYVSLFTSFSLPLISTLVAANFSPFSYRRYI